jgi:hypothetical protein
METKGAAKKKAAKAKKKAPKKKASQAEKDHAARSARGAKGTKRTERPQRDTPKETQRKLPNAGQLQRLLADVNDKLDKAAHHSGKGRQAIAEAKKDIGLNPTAFNMIKRLHKLGTKDPNALMVLLEDFDHYREMLKVDDLAGGNLFANTEVAGEPQAEAAEAGQQGNDGATVHRLSPAA